MLLKNTVTAARARDGASDGWCAGRADRRHRDGQVLLPRARFAALGVPTIDADRLARAGGRAGLARPRRRRRAVRRRACCARTARSTARRSARIVFADRVARADLEAIVHPDGLPAHPRVVRAAAARRRRVAIADIPLLFETGHEHDFDAVVVVACAPDGAAAPPDGARRPRRRRRRGRGWRRSGRSTRRSRRADYVIRTDGGVCRDRRARSRSVYEG